MRNDWLGPVAITVCFFMIIVLTVVFNKNTVNIQTKKIGEYSVQYVGELPPSFKIDGVKEMMLANRNVVSVTQRRSLSGNKPIYLLVKWVRKNGGIKESGQIYGPGNLIAK